VSSAPLCNRRQTWLTAIFPFRFSAVGKHPAAVASPLGMVGGQTLTCLGNCLGTFVLGFALSWKMLLVGISPLLFLIPVGWRAYLFFDALAQVRADSSPSLSDSPSYLVEIRYGAMYEEEAGKSVDLATSFGSEAVDSVKTLAAFGQELQILRKLDKMQQPNWRARNKLAGLAAFFFGFSQAIVPMILALFFWYSGHELANGKTKVSTVRLALLYHSFLSAS
jgi:ABC-type multidrug transport system fused ATPase/permease subunit